MTLYVQIAIFGILGVFSRYFIQILLGRILSLSFPIGTFLINILGSFLIGVIYVLGFEKTMINPELRIGIMVGFLGGLTTFSSYSLESLHLFEQAKPHLALFYFIGTPILGFGATLIGVWITRKNIF